MLHFLVHLCGLLFQSQDLLSIGLDVFLEFFDFVVKNELKLLQLLSLLLQLIDAEVFFAYSCLTLRKFVILRLNCLSARVSFVKFAVQFTLHVCNLVRQSLSLGFLLFELVVDQSQVTLLFHTVVNNTGQRLFLFFLNLVDGVPNFLLNLLSSLFVTSDHAFYILRQHLLCVL